jgi:hypothetical protein
MDEIILQETMEAKLGTGTRFDIGRVEESPTQ